MVSKKRRFYIAAVTGAQLIGQATIQILIILLIGPGEKTDTFIAAQTIPFILLAVGTASLHSVWYTKLTISNADDNRSQFRRKKSIGYAHSIISALIALILSLISTYFSESFIFTGFSKENIENFKDYSYILSFCTFFGIISAYISITLRSQEFYLLAETPSLVGTVILLIFLSLTLRNEDITMAAWGMLTRSIIIYSIQLFIIDFKKPLIKTSITRKDEWLKMLPITLTTPFYKASPLVDRHFASHTQAGGITDLNIAQTIISSVIAISEKVYITPLIPSFSNLINRKEKRKAYKLYIRSLFIITSGTLIIITALGISFIFIPQLLSDLMNIDQSLTKNLIEIMIILSGFLFASLSGILTNAFFFTIGSNKTPAQIGIIGFLIGIIYKYILFLMFGIKGIALGITLHYMSNFGILFLILRKKLHE